MPKLYDNTLELIEICEALEGVKKYISKSPYRTGSQAASIATGISMYKTGVITKTAAKNLPWDGAANTLVKAREATAIPGSEVVTNAISKGIKYVTGSNNPVTDTIGISALPIGVGLAAYGIGKVISYYRSLKHKEAKLKSLQQYLSKLRSGKVPPEKIQKIQKQIQNLQIDINAEKSVLNKEKQVANKKISEETRIENSKKSTEKNQDKLKKINSARQVLSKVH